ncbi:hypothetical protein DAEQUDRAFT_141093 [Daedalea quercina L-15889]|uniref:Uncharacterized protein n=1 Tax=Daedalea quercina L-15889 TaxID=1314783 RepID=A0A165RUP2_9APHY|nr:hypothetical protein DAEQUDRAFT_141093 [Daedalea quercina L-15889]
MTVGRASRRMLILCSRCRKVAMIFKASLIFKALHWALPPVIGLDRLYGPSGGDTTYIACVILGPPGLHPRLRDCHGFLRGLASQPSVSRRVPAEWRSFRAPLEVPENFTSALTVWCRKASMCSVHELTTTGHLNGRHTNWQNEPLIDTIVQ